MGGPFTASIRIAGSFLAPLVDFILPPLCVSCTRLLVEGEKHICRTCWDSIPRLTKGHPLFFETRRKLVETGIVADLVSAFLFEKEGVFRDLAHALKYGGFESIGIMLGRELGRMMKADGIRADLLIPVPLHKAKLRGRGFNQADLIAGGMSEVTGIPLRDDLVRRCRPTRTQTKLRMAERQRNMEGAFEVNATANALDSKTVVVVDDVITTGATLVSCAKVLVEEGAARVVAASAALAE